MSKSKTSLVPVVPVESVIRFIRGQKVILDADLAAIYGVETRTLNQAMKRNRERFPQDFVFQLTTEEADGHRSQSVTASQGQPRAGNRSQSVIGSQKHRDPRYLPYAFTEHGAIMAANVLRSRQALQMSVFVVRAFVRLREVLATNAHLAQKLAELERKVTGHDADIQQLFEAIRQLLTRPEPPRKQIGFQVRERRTVYRVIRKMKSAAEF